MDDEQIIATLAGHLGGDRANRVRLLTDAVRMDNVAADLAYDDPALRNAMRSLADLRVERTFLGLHRPTAEVLDELAQRLSAQQGIRADTARRCVWLIDSAYFGQRPVHLPTTGPTPATHLPAPPAPPALPPPLVAPAHLVGATARPVPGPARLPLPGSPRTPSGARPWWRRTPVLAGGAVTAVALIGVLVALGMRPGLGAISGLTADTASSPGSVVLSWQPVTGADGYEVCRDGTVCDQVSVTRFTDSPPDQSTHTYSVQARSGSAGGAPASVQAAAASGTGLTEAHRALIATLSDRLVDKDSCKRADTKARAAVACDSPSDASTSAPGVLWVLQFDRREDMESVFAADTPGAGAPSCPGSGSTTWTSDQAPGVDIGNIACYQDDSTGKAVVAWTYWNRKIILYGVSRGTDVGSVYTWWKTAPIPAP